MDIILHFICVERLKRKTKLKVFENTKLRKKTIITYTYTGKEIDYTLKENITRKPVARTFEKVHEIENAIHARFWQCTYAREDASWKRVAWTKITSFKTACKNVDISLSALKSRVSLNFSYASVHAKWLSTRSFFVRFSNFLVFFII